MWENKILENIRDKSVYDHSLSVGAGLLVALSPLQTVPLNPHNPSALTFLRQSHFS